MARQATQAVVRKFVESGGTYRHGAVRAPDPKQKLTGVVTSTGESIVADVYVFACGAWLGKIFPDVLGSRIFPSRQEVFFFGTPAGSAQFAPPQMPTWIDFSDDRGMYGFPDIETRGFKVAFDLHGPAFDPDTGTRIVSTEKIAMVRAYVKDRFPALGRCSDCGLEGMPIREHIEWRFCDRSASGV